MKVPFLRKTHIHFVYKAVIKQELSWRREKTSCPKNYPKLWIVPTEDRQEIVGISECTLVYRHLWPRSLCTIACKNYRRVLPSMHG